MRIQDSDMSHSSHSRPDIRIVHSDIRHSDRVLQGSITQHSVRKLCTMMVMVHGIQLSDIRLSEQLRAVTTMSLSDDRHSIISVQGNETWQSVIMLSMVLRQQHRIIQLSDTWLVVGSRQVRTISSSDMVLRQHPVQHRISSISVTGSMEIVEISV